MNVINSKSIINLLFELRWESESARHSESFLGKVNLYRDILPKKKILYGKKQGDFFELEFSPGELVGEYDNKKVRFITWDGLTIKNFRPNFGRFYPLGLLKDLPWIFPENTKPFRCIGEAFSGFMADLNHPLAGRAVTLKITVKDIWQKERTDMGGEVIDWIEKLTYGPGMNARYMNEPTAFFDEEDAFKRENTEDDKFFYKNPRYVHHLDSEARENIRELYRKLLSPGQKVLDLMSSWESHLSANLNLIQITGLGLNKDELSKNPALDDFLIHDLNEKLLLPFRNDHYDACICTASVEYLIKPFEVFSEIHRILKRDGLFVCVFSNRWFPPKVIKIWPEIHPFERVGLVLEYFLRDGFFKEIQTISIRGFPRPEDDKYYPKYTESDPVFAVCGRANK